MGSPPAACGATSSAAHMSHSRGLLYWIGDGFPSRSGFVSLSCSSSSPFLRGASCRQALPQSCTYCTHMIPNYANGLWLGLFVHR
jgi:hypothetical protein